jgi:hypothetical protein
VLRRVVGGLRRVALHAGDGGVVDDRAATGGDDRREFVLEAVEDARQVEGERPLPVVAVGLAHAGHRATASVVERTVQPAVLSHRGIDEPRHLFLDRDVGGHEEGGTARLPDLRGDLFAPVLVPGTDDDASPFLGRPLGERQAHALRTAGHEQHL